VWEMVLQEKGGEYSSVNLTILKVPYRVTICKIINTLRHAGPLPFTRQKNQNMKFSLKRNWMEEMLLVDIPLKRSSDVLHRRWGFRIVSMSCNRTPETRHLRQQQACRFHPYSFTNTVNFCNWILQSIYDSEISAHLILFSDDDSFHLHGV
jgi:hypothetical protein